jgi:hypothetical protein
MDLDGGIPLTDASSSARWRNHIIPAAQWMQERIQAGGYVSGVCSWPGISFHGIVLDWVHMCDLGVAQACLGNILWEVFLRLGGLVTHEHPTMTRILNYLCDAAHDLGHQMPISKLTLGMIRGSDQRPKLKEKAGKTRGLAPIVLRMLELHFPPEGDRELRVVKCLEFLSKAYMELDNWGADSADRLEEFCRRHLLLYASLAIESLRADSRFLCWRWYPHAPHAHAPHGRAGDTNGQPQELVALWG